MLDPERKQHIADGTEYISSLLHEELVKIVSEAIVTRMERGVDYRLTARDRWMLELLQDAGYMREALEKEIAAKTRLMLREVQAAFEDAAVESVAWDDEVYYAAGLEPTPLRQSPTLMRLAERGYEKTRGELVNFTGTMASASQQLFIRECDKAYTLVASGAMGHAQAVRQAVETAAGDGIIVRYPSGHRDTIETATGRAVRTGVGQACGDMTLARMDELDWDIVLVSSHLGARTGDGGDNWTNHYYLQSLGFFSRSGSSKKFKALSVCGIGYVDGLLGANCRHSIGPGDGVHNPYAHYDSEENRLREELEQRQRLLERRVRDTKRKVQGLKAAMDKAEDPADREELRGRYQQTARKLQRQNRDYNEFCEANELKQYRERLHIAGWDRKQAASATGAARAAEKAAENTLAKSVEKSIIQDREGYARQEGNEPVIPERYKDDFDDFEPLTIDQEERAVLESLHQQAIGGKVEYGQGWTGEGFTRVFTSNKPDRVQIPEDILSAPGLRLYHAHTNVTPLSGDDFKLLTGDNIERVSVVTKNGDVYSAWIGDGERPSAEEFEEVMGWLRPEVDYDMLSWPDSLSWSTGELNYMSIREQAFRIARHFKWHLEGGKL